MDVWKDNRKLYLTLSLLSIIHNEYFISISLFILPNYMYYKITGYISKLKYNYFRISLSLFASLIVIFPLEIKAIYVLLGAFFFPLHTLKMSYYTLFGFMSDYNLGHIMYLIIIHQFYELYIDNSI